MAYTHLASLRHEFVLQPSSVKMGKCLHYCSHVGLVQRLMLVEHAVCFTRALSYVFQDL